MERRKFFKNTLGYGLAAQPFIRALDGLNRSDPVAQRANGVNRPAPGPLHANGMNHPLITSGPRAPLTIYDNWSAYDELSDKIPLTEELAMQEMRELIRLKRQGVQVDYYMMDAFWFDKMGGYRSWHRQHWPDGPDKWLSACKENNILPGMWFSTNLIATHSGRFLEPVPEWQDSLATDPSILCLFSGGYLRHLAETLRIWYGKGVRAFKFDFAYFNAATRKVQETHLPAEIEEMNKLAIMDMLKQFRALHTDVLITGYNGFGGDLENTYTPFRKTVDPRWMETFDTIYCGDPRFSDVPAMNSWRSQDIYSDHMVRQFEFNGLPLRRIDNCGFMIGTTGTCYYRGLHAWKGMLILELARAGWVNVYHGNLELLSDEDARWFARAQGMFHQLQEFGSCTTFGEIPGQGFPYGFRAEAINGAILTIVNPSQAFVSFELPVSSYSRSAVIYSDGGFRPVLTDKFLRLGPEQLAVIGLDEYAADKYSLGVDETIRIPVAIENMEADFKATQKNTIEAFIKPLPGKHLRIIFQQFGADGQPRRSWGGAPPDGQKMNSLLRIIAEQGKKQLPLRIEYDKMIWSGLSWAAAEISPDNFDAGKQLKIGCLSAETDKLQLQAHVYGLTY